MGGAIGDLGKSISTGLGDLGTGIGDILTGGAISQSERAQELQKRSMAESGQFLKQEDAFIKGIRALAEKQSKGLLEAPSVAQMATQQGLDQAMSQGIASSQSQRGLSPSLAAAIAARGQAMMGIDTIARGAVAQTEEALQRQQQAFAAQMMAEDMAKQLIGARRGQALQQMQVASQAEQAAGQRWAGLVSGIGQGLTSMASAGGGAKAAKPMSKGGLIPGKPIKQQDTVENDVVPALLSPGELVIPRSVVKKGPEAVKNFAMAILAKGGKYDDLA